VRTRHVRDIGAFLAEMHGRCERFHGDKRGEADIADTGRFVDRIHRAADRRRLAQRYDEPVNLISREMESQLQRRPRSKTGIGHGALFLDAAKFSNEALSAVLDFESAGRERFTLDMAIAINAWCWEPAARQRGGPAGRFNRRKVQAFIKAYETLRPLDDAAREDLVYDLRLAALRFAAARMVHYELKRPPEGAVFRDYRHYTARLAALRSSAERLVHDAG